MYLFVLYLGRVESSKISYLSAKPKKISMILPNRNSHMSWTSNFKQQHDGQDLSIGRWDDLNTRTVIVTMTSVQKDSVVSWFHDYHRATIPQNSRNLGTTQHNSKVGIGWEGSAVYHSPPGFFCMQTRSSEALVLQLCVCARWNPCLLSFWHQKTEPVADHTSISRSLEMVVASTLWSWLQTHDDRLSHSCLWRISFDHFLIVFYLRTSGFLKFIKSRYMGVS